MKKKLCLITEKIGYKTIFFHGKAFVARMYKCQNFYMLVGVQNYTYYLFYTHNAAVSGNAFVY